jgi:hypothetical protein
MVEGSRAVWGRVKKTNPGKQCKHPDLASCNGICFAYYTCLIKLEIPPHSDVSKENLRIDEKG